ncbi:protein SPA1-RELATED 3-like isoform X2 [Rutidosis leptorrhynchoides]|uniref:protein SPA1-RELATED 3-like isoform X2 n=1 Tax=Rutidosis leptorrhynchoides TaxID=125765 RepID=UPI003A9A17A7
MENSSAFGYQISGSSRGLNYSEASNRNPISDHDKAQSNRANTQFGYFLEDGGAVIRPVEHKDVSLRQWLDDSKRVVDAFKCLHIFMQIVDIVKLAHSQGIVVHNIRPSCFVMSLLNRVSFIESASCSDSDSDTDLKGSCSPFPLRNVSRSVSDSTWLQSSLENLEVSYIEQAEENTPKFPMKRILEMETDWYTSPEEAAGLRSSCASDVYRLGALLFELYCTCSTTEEKNATMSNMRHRVFPPQLLLKWPKEALFCLWLLHPEPASRPNIDEVLQSEFLTKLRDSLDERVAAIEFNEKIDEQELLLEFLLMMKQRKQETAKNLCSIVSDLTSDLEYAMKLQSSINKNIQSTLDIEVENISPVDDSATSGSRKRIKPTIESRYTNFHQEEENQENAILKNPRLMKNFRKLESAYFLTRRRALKPKSKYLDKSSPIISKSKESIVHTEKSYVTDFLSKDRVAGRKNRWISTFLDGLCKYLSYSKLKLQAHLKQGDLLGSSNLVCSLSFDRDGEFFATAGVNKKIKVFEYDSILNGNRDVNYPVVEMASRAKLSSICWNSYIKGQIASCNFEGTVEVWDVTRSRVFTEMKEHERRAWSVDFSSVDPTLLASGSDDGSVKLWNINQAILFLHLVDVKLSN